MCTISASPRRPDLPSIAVGAGHSWQSSIRPWLEEAAGLLRGTHTFKAFAKSGQPERGDSCTIHEARWEPWRDLGLTFVITANRFLHHMVRYLVGTMVDVARGRRPLDDFRRLLDGSGDDLRTSPPAPPEGLFLHHVAYPDNSPNPLDDGLLHPPTQ